MASLVTDDTVGGMEVEFEEDIVPHDTPCTADVIDIDFSPKTNIYAAGLINGTVEFYQYSSGMQATCVTTLQHHTQSCRNVRFCSNNNSNNILYTTSLDKTISAIDVNKATQNSNNNNNNSNDSIMWSKSDAHGSNTAVNVMLPIEPNVFASGDDEGNIKIWDIRQSNPIVEFGDQEDYVGDMAVSKDLSRLYSAGGDGTLAVYNLKQRKLKKKSECMEDELLSIEIMKNGKKIVTGTQGGVLNIFNQNEYEDISDRFPGHPESVQSIVKIDEDTLLTGSSDGLIRIINILPNKLIGIVGEHDEEFPVERICRSYDNNLIASISHDNVVKFWDISYLQEDEEDLSSAMALDNVDSLAQQEELGEQGSSSSSSSSTGMMMDGSGVNPMKLSNTGYSYKAFDRNGIPMTKKNKNENDNKKNDKKMSSDNKKRKNNDEEEDDFFSDL